MAQLLKATQEILAADLDPRFLESASVRLAWNYHSLYDEIQHQHWLPLEVKQREFANRRSLSAVDALVFACEKHGVPYNFRKLKCNGQQKLIIKCGRVCLIQEPILELCEKPRTADYKRELADTYGLIRQLELDLGDQPRRILNWSGEVLGVILHGAAGPNFNRRDKELGGLTLGVPDASYSHWAMRLDIHQVAMWGFVLQDKDILDWGEFKEAIQEDNVRVQLKSKSRSSGRAAL